MLLQMYLNKKVKVYKDSEIQTSKKRVYSLKNRKSMTSRSRTTFPIMINSFKNFMLFTLLLGTFLLPLCDALAVGYEKRELDPTFVSMAV